MSSSLQKFLQKQQPAVTQQNSEGAFEESTPIVPKRGLKLENPPHAKSATAPKPEDFRNKINEILEKEEEQKELAYKLVSKFQTILKDKTLDSAKDPKVRDEETDSIRDLIDFSRIINSDETKEEDLGTISLFITLLRSFLIQRDRINELEYLQIKMGKEIAALNSRIANLQKSG